MTNAANLRGWVPDDAAVASLTDWKSWNKLAPLLVETAKAHREGGIQGDVRDRNGAQNTSVEKEEKNRSIPRTTRTELALSRNLEKEKSIETREAPGQDQGECRDGESSQENAEQAFQLEINCKGRKIPNLFSQNISETSTQSQKNKLEELTQSERRHWEKRERLTGSNHSRCFESIASRMFGTAGEVAVVDVLEHGFPGRLAVFVDGDGSESGGCNVLDQVQAYCWTLCDAKSLGLRLAQVTSSAEIRKCADCVCAEDTCRCWFVFAVCLESGREKLWWYSWT